MQITVTGLDEVISKINNLKDNIKIPIMQGIYQTVAEAEKIVQSAYSSQSENSDFTISIEEYENGFAVVAQGEDIGFLEFGAGIGVDSTNEFVAEVSYPVYPGSYSETEGTGRFAKHGFWWHDGKYYTWIAPTRGMQQAVDYIRNNIMNNIEERLNAWTRGS